MRTIVYICLYAKTYKGCWAFCDVNRLGLILDKMISKGDKVKVDYEGRLESGEVFDSSTRDGTSTPLEFEVGSGMVIKGFDEGVIGMKEGEEKEIVIEPKEAYGERDDARQQEIPKSSLPQEILDKGLNPGMNLVVQNAQGQKMPVLIKEVKDDAIVLDLNHPLAGKKLIFKVKVKEIGKSE